MAGLRDTLQKLVPDKLKNMSKKRQLPPDSADEVNPKQPRTVPASSTKHKHATAAAQGPSPIAPSVPSSTGMEYTWNTRSASRQSSSTSSSRLSSAYSRGISHPSSELTRQVESDEILARELQEQIDDGDHTMAHQDGSLAHRSPPFRPQHVPTANEVLQLQGAQDFSQLTRHGKCSACNKGRPTKLMAPSEVVARTRRMAKEGIFHPFLRCETRRCSSYSCVGCDAACDRPDFSNCVSGKGFKVSWCCDASRRFLIWSLACGPEWKDMDGEQRSGSFGGISSRLRSATRAQKEKAAEEAAQQAKAPPSPPKAKGPGKKDSAMAKGTGYGGDSHHNLMETLTNKRPSASKKPTVAPSADDRLLVTYMQALVLLLPSDTREKTTSFDRQPQPLVSFCLARSPLTALVHELIGKASVQEISEHEDMYTAAVQFLEMIVNHPSLTPIATQEFVLYPPEQMIARFAMRPGSSRGAMDVDADDTGLRKTRSVQSVLDILTKQCNHYLNMVTALPDDAEEKASSITKLFRQVVALSQLLEECTTSAPSPMDVDTSASKGKQNAALDSGGTTEFERWCREHCMEEVPEEKLLECFYFKDSAKDLAKDGASNPRRMKKLLQQVADLHTSLPDGILVRYCPNLLGVMKVLIIGPRGTPYENGLFEFDLFCGPKYPDKAPEMHFRTTGGGRVGFNPNLYNTGKICLSLLGTWSGQPWEPNKSTLLQVLVSIQAMIFVEEPWYNEPGREMSRNSAASNSYNKQLQRDTIVHAMTYWLNERLAKPNASGDSGSSTTVDEKTTIPSGSGSSSGSGSKSSSTSVSASASAFGLLSATTLATSASGSNSSSGSGSASGSSSSLGSSVVSKLKGPGKSKVKSKSKAATSSESGSAASSDSKDKIDAPVIADKNTPPDAASATGFFTLSSTGAATGVGNIWSNSIFGSGLPATALSSSAAGPALPVPTAAQVMSLALSSVSSPGAETTVQPPPANMTLTFQNMIDQLTHGQPPTHQQLQSLFGPNVPSMEVLMEFAVESSENGNGATLFDEDYSYVCRMPEGNTKADGNDDYIWGEAVRRHFSEPAAVLAVVDKWKGKSSATSPIGAASKSLRDALKAHGFIKAK